MRFPRIRFSLRTLLLGTLLAGGVMLVWRATWPVYRKIDFPTKATFPEGYPVRRYDPLEGISFFGDKVIVQYNRQSPGLSYSGGAISGVWTQWSVFGVVDIENNKVEQCFSGDDYEWLPQKDLLMFTSGGTWLMKFSEMKTLAYYTHPNTTKFHFAGDGKCLLSFKGFPPPSEFRIYRETDWQSAREFPGVSEFLAPWVDDASGILLLIKPIAKDKSGIEVEAWNLESMTRIWARNLPNDAAFVRGHFLLKGKIGLHYDVDGSEESKYLAFDLKTGRDLPAPKDDHELFSDPDSDTSAPPAAGSLPAPEFINPNTARFDGTNWLAISEDRRQILFSSRIGTEFKPTRKMLSAAGSTIQIIGGSPDGLKVVALLDDGIGYWRMAPTYASIWNFYKMPECLCAMLLLLAFLWSVHRDWKEGRKIALEAKSVSPTVSV